MVVFPFLSVTENILHDSSRGGRGGGGYEYQVVPSRRKHFISTTLNIEQTVHHEKKARYTRR